MKFAFSAFYNWEKTTMYGFSVTWLTHQLANNSETVSVTNDLCARVDLWLLWLYGSGRCKLSPAFFTKHWVKLSKRIQLFWFRTICHQLSPFSTSIVRSYQSRSYHRWSAALNILSSGAWLHWHCISCNNLLPCTISPSQTFPFGHPFLLSLVPINPFLIILVQCESTLLIGSNDNSDQFAIFMCFYLISTALIPSLRSSPVFFTMTLSCSSGRFNLLSSFYVAPMCSSVVVLKAYWDSFPFLLNWLVNLFSFCTTSCRKLSCLAMTSLFSFKIWSVKPSCKSHL